MTIANFMAQQNPLGARVKILKALAIAVLAWSTAPVQAQTVNFSYVGNDRTAPVVVPGQGTQIRITDGAGFFSLFQPPSSPTRGPVTPTSFFGLGDLDSFSLDTSTILTFSQVNPVGFPSSAFYSYGLADLTAFSATFGTNGLLTALSFDTRAISPASVSGGAIFAAQRFTLTGLGLNGASTFDTQGRLITSGDLLIAAVPEPQSWTLMIVGFGMAGAAIRRRRRQVVFA